jgi:DNA anti-recombination protein RmuC
MSVNQILEQVRDSLYANEFKSLSDNFVKLRDELNSLQTSLDTMNARLEKMEASKHISNVAVTVESVPEIEETEASKEEVA